MEFYPAHNNFVYQELKSACQGGCLIPFVGRTDELARLREFCGHPEQVSWWAVTGPGGIGKSRLVYQFTNEQEAAGWSVHWLKHSDYDNLAHWTPPTDRCIVVADDVQAHISAVGSWIASVSERLRSEKLRVLLLERSGKGLDSAEWAEMLQSDSPYDDTISSKCYCPDFLALGPLSDDELKAIMMDFAKTSGRPLADIDHAGRLLQTLKKIDSGLQRPMYALAITDAWCSGEDPTHWNKGQILDALINRELKFYYERLRRLSSVSKEMRAELENLLARSCLMPFLPLNQVTDADYPKLSQKAGKLDMDLPELLHQIGAVHKITVHIKIGTPKGRAERKETMDAVVLDCPDLVKEYLVLRQAFDKGHLSVLLPEGWDNDPMTLLFLNRLLVDYPERLGGNNSFLSRFFAGNPASELPARIYGALLFGTTVQLPEKGKEALERLAKLYDQFRASEDITIEYAKGLVNLNAKQALKERIHSVDQLRLLFQAFPASEELADVYATGLFNLAADQALEDRTLSVEELRQLYEQFPANEKIAATYAQGLAGLSASQTLEDCGSSVDRLKRLHEQFSENETFAVMYASGLLSLTALQAPEDCGPSTDQLRQLHEQFLESKTLAAVYAQGLINLSITQGEEGCGHSVDLLKQLYEQPSADEPLAAAYASGLLSLTSKQALEGCGHSVDKLRQLHERFPASERILTEYARGLFNLSLRQALGDRAASVDQMKLFYEQYPKNKDLAVVYAQSLVNLSLIQTGEADVRETLAQSEKLLAQYPEATIMQLLYAKTQFNLTLQQEGESLCQTVAQLREFLLAHPDANPEFQDALDTYLDEHPTHKERYAPLRI